jgi:SagB-type dehydrogenase family enzyme
MPGDHRTITLPPPRLDGETSVEAALARRRSVRRYAAGALELAEVAQLLWAAQGVTEPGAGSRAAPSAGARFPLELYVVARDVAGLSAGVHRYRPDGHRLDAVVDGHVEEELCAAALSQPAIRTAPATLVFTSVLSRVTGRYGERAQRYVLVDLGHAAENVYLQAAAVGLATVAVGAFDDAAVKRVLQLGGGEEPLYLMPVGRPA